MIPQPGPSRGGAATLDVMFKIRGAAGYSNGVSPSLMGGAGAAITATVRIPRGTPLRLLVGRGGPSGWGNGGGLAAVGLADLDFDDLFLIAAGGGGSSRAANGNGNGGAGGIDEGEDGTGDYAGQGGTQLAGGPGGVGPHTTGEAGSQLTGGNASTASGTRDYGNGGLSGTSGDNGGGGAGKYGGGGGGGNSGVRGGTGGGGSSLVPAPGKMTVGEFVEFIEILEATGYAGAGTTPGLDGDTELGSVAGVPVAGTPGGDARICISEDGGSTWTTYDYTGADQTHVVGSTL